MYELIVSTYNNIIYLPLHMLMNIGPEYLIGIGKNKDT